MKHEIGVGKRGDRRGGTRGGRGGRGDRGGDEERRERRREGEGERERCFASWPTWVCSLAPLRVPGNPAKKDPRVRVRSERLSPNGVQLPKLTKKSSQTT